MKNIYTLLFLFSLVFAFNGCKKEDDSSPGGGLTQTGDQITTNISGVVRDLQGNPVTGAQVTAGGQTASTNSSGVYLLQNVSVNKTRAVVSAVKSGYWLQQKGFIAQTNATSYADIVLFTDDKSYSLNSSSGGTVTMPGGSTIQFPANAFVNSSGNSYNGTVYITAHEILTSDPAYSLRVPGGDFIAKDNSGQQVLLLSYGMTGAKLYDAAGNQLSLAPGINAAIRMPVNPSHQGTAPATIPLWHYDEIQMLWVEEGTAALNGNFYEGNVAHFSWWNYDIPGNYCTLSMLLKSCGTPLSGYYVHLTSSIWSGYSISGSNGWNMGTVPANVVLQVSISSTYNGTPDTVFTIGPFTSMSNNTMTVDIGLCISITGTLYTCDSVLINGNVALLQNNQTVGFATTIGGVYTFSNLSPGAYQLVATSGQLTGSGTFNIPPGGTLDLYLCDTIASTPGNFTMTFNSTATGAFTYTANVTQAEYVLTNGTPSIVFTYEDSVSGVETTMILGIPNYTPGSFIWNSTDTYLDANVIYSGQPASVNSVSGQTVLTTAPSVGNVIMGTFGGQVIMDAGNGITIPGTLTGNFSVVRTQ